MNTAKNIDIQVNRKFEGLNIQTISNYRTLEQSPLRPCVFA